MHSVVTYLHPPSTSSGLIVDSVTVVFGLGELGRDSSEDGLDPSVTDIDADEVGLELPDL